MVRWRGGVVVWWRDAWLCDGVVWWWRGGAVACWFWGHLANILTSHSSQFGSRTFSGHLASILAGHLANSGCWDSLEPLA